MEGEIAAPIGIQSYEEDVLAGDSAAVNLLRLQVKRIAPHFRTALRKHRQPRCASWTYVGLRVRIESRKLEAPAGERKWVLMVIAAFATGVKLHRPRSFARLSIAVALLSFITAGAGGQVNVAPPSPAVPVPAASYSVNKELVDGPDVSASSIAGSGQAAGQKAPAGAGQISGTVVGPEGDVIADASVTVSRDGTNELRKTKTDSDGRFHFEAVPPGRFRLNVTSQGLSQQTIIGVLHPGENYATPTIRLNVAVSTSVQVVASQQELAEAEIKVEEHQRLLGVLPNFFVTYDWHAAPLTTRQKFELAWKNASDPANIAVAGAVAGAQQANNTFSGYGQGADGYGKRLGAAMGDLVIGTFMGGAVLPTVFRQDPRYFYKGTGTVKSRVSYALSRAVICRGDNGKWQPAYASMLGDLSAGALTNLYLPAGSRDGAALTFEEGFLNIAGDAAGNVVQEFLYKHFTPHAPVYSLADAP